jgi:hypothetical protein
MTKARNIANLASDGSALADGTINYTDITGTPAAALPLAGGTLTNNVNLGDNVKANFGAGSDLQIYHNGSHSIISDEGTGSLLLQGSTQIVMQHPTTGEDYIIANANGSVQLYHDNAQKLATTATGISVTGTVAATAVTGDGSGLTNLPVAAAAIAQVKKFSVAIPNTTTTSLSFISTPITLSITPTSATSYIHVHIYGFNMGTSLVNKLPIATIYRGAINLGAGYDNDEAANAATSSNGDIYGIPLFFSRLVSKQPGIISFMDHPNTTSATTYTMYWRGRFSGYTYSLESGNYTYPPQATIILTEYVI